MKTDKVGKWGVIVIKFGWDKGWVGHECTNERILFWRGEWFVATNARMSEFYFLFWSECGWVGHEWTNWGI